MTHPEDAAEQPATTPTPRTGLAASLAVLEEQRLIDIATGILRQRHDLPVPDARARLQQLADERHLSIVAAATHVVTQVGGG